MTFVSEWLTYAQDSRAITDDDNVFGLGTVLELKLFFEKLIVEKIGKKLK